MPSTMAGPTASSPSTAGRKRQESEEQYRDEVEELSNWKENVPMLYRFMAAHVLEWPSLTIDWVSGRVPAAASTLSLELRESDEIKAQQMTRQRQVPVSATRAQTAATNGECVQTVVVATHTDSNSFRLCNSILYMDIILPTITVPLSCRNYRAHKDYSGFSYGQDCGKFYIRRVLPRPGGEANKVSVMPQNEDIVASIGANGSASVIVCKTSASATGTESLPVVIPLRYHSLEGWGLSWAPSQQGLLATAADDCTVCIWDVEASTRSIGRSDGSTRRSEIFEVSSTTESPYSGGTTKTAPKLPTEFLPDLHPLATGRQHSSPVQDVVWRPNHNTELFSVGDDGSLVHWDIRTVDSGVVSQIAKLEIGPMNTVDISPCKPFLVATGGECKDVCLWDLRNLSRSLCKMSGHESAISRLEFSRTNDRYIASCGNDRFALVWDMAAIGKEQAPEDAASGPPELIFKHAGHATAINDISWCKDPAFEGMIATVSEDNHLQLWHPSEVIYSDSDNSDDEGRLDDLDEDDFPVE